MVSMKTHSVELNLKSGRVEIEYTDALLEQIRARFGMAAGDEVSDDLIVAYLENEVRSALAKAEAEG